MNPDDPLNLPEPERPFRPPPPSSQQFGLRGMFILITVSCLIFGAVSAIGIQQPIHALGAVVIALFCVLTIVVIEGFRVFFEGRADRAIADQRHAQALDELFQAVSPFKDGDR